MVSLYTCARFVVSVTVTLTRGFSDASARFVVSDSSETGSIHFFVVLDSAKRKISRMPLPGISILAIRAGPNTT